MISAEESCHGLAEPQRVDRVGDRGVRSGPVREPPVVGATDQHEDRRAGVQLVPQLLGQAESSGGGRLAVEDRQTDTSGVHVSGHDRRRGDLGVVHFRQVRVRMRAQCGDDAAAGGRVVAVDEDPELDGRAGDLGHGRDATERERRRWGDAGVGPRWGGEVLEAGDPEELCGRYFFSSKQFSLPTFSGSSPLPPECRTRLCGLASGYRTVKVRPEAQGRRGAPDRNERTRRGIPVPGVGGISLWPAGLEPGS